MSSIHSGPRHLPQWTSKFTSKLVRSSRGGEAYAFRYMVDRVTLLREICATSENLSPGTIGFRRLRSLLTHLVNEKAVAGRGLVCHFRDTQQGLKNDKLDNGYWPPGEENHAGALTWTESDTALLQRMLQWGPCCPGAPFPLCGAPFQENGGARYIFRMLL